MMATSVLLPERGVGLKGPGWKELKEKANQEPVKKSWRSDSGR